MPKKELPTRAYPREQLVKLSEAYDSKVRLLFQLRNYISLVKYDPRTAKHDKSMEFRRFVSNNDLELWDTIQAKADTRKVSKRVQNTRKEIEQTVAELRTNKLKAPRKSEPVLNSRPPRSIPRAPPPRPSNRSPTKRHAEDMKESDLVVDSDLGWPDELDFKRPHESKRQRLNGLAHTNSLIMNPWHYIKPKTGDIGVFLSSYKTISDDNEPISAELWDKKVAADAAGYMLVNEARKSGKLDNLAAQGVGNSLQIPKFIGPVVTEPSYLENLLTHAVQWSKQRQNLRKFHQSIIKRNSQSVEQYFRRLAGAEDREKKELDRQLRQIARKTSQEVLKKWKLAEKIVEQRLEAVRAEEKREKGKEYLNSILDKSAKLIESRIGEVESSEEEEDADEVEDVNDAELTLEQLREKYKDIPDLSASEKEDDDGEEKEEEEVEKPCEEALKLYAETQDQNEDESESDSENDSYDESDDSEDESEEKRPNLAALFGGKVDDDDEDAAISEDEAEEVETKVDSKEAEEPAEEPAEELAKEPAELSKEEVDAEIAMATEEAKDEVVENADVEMEDAKVDTEMTDAEVRERGLHKIEPPFLLRGTLREYQRNGLDWLAGLVTSGTNGILADEMGLGKTIQTIALLSWLACEKHIWGPHLIIVPTSVMLNWEMEFKKFAPGFKILTYFGTPQQRKRKRRGWNKEDTWHVCITSYQLVIQDQVVFRGKRWQYMVLDEAHNIKNFRSQRWQALLNFNAQHRLLLTGTPLQNNLVELWSLLYFLMPSTRATQMMPAGFASLDDFQEWFAKPVDQMVEEGEEADDEARATISKLHQVLRPYLLRRLKVDVEKQMPGKYEHVVYCRLSKRQRYLYDDFMSRASTRATLESGNFMSILNCLMQLRKVCNHPDLFEVRPIVTSYAIDHNVAYDYGLHTAPRFRVLDESLLQFRLLDKMNLVFAEFEEESKVSALTRYFLGMDDGTIEGSLKLTLDSLEAKHAIDDDEIEPDFNSVEGWARYDLYKRRVERIDRQKKAIRQNALATMRIPFFGTDCLQAFRVFQLPIKGVLSLTERERDVAPLIERFACITAPVVTLDYAEEMLGPVANQIYTDPEFEPFVRNHLFHEPQVKLSVAFPDKRLLQYDCGKLQKLAVLLRDLISNGHRVLIFTQMTRVLDVLEQFLNLHGWRYMRLDGATRIEQRQAMTERFNKDDSVPVFILSTRSGGLGINLTGADSVIFYDSDWNPAMDRQCQDRCHRIGQTRDVHIYRLVSEFTIESNILRKATQKTILDNVVIQEGDFTTEYFSRMSVHDILGNDAGRSLPENESALTLEELQKAGTKRLEAAFAEAEDRDDQVAANLAMNEARMDQEEFAETKQPLSVDSSTELRTPSVEPEEQQAIGHIDDWMILAIERGNLF